MEERAKKAGTYCFWAAVLIELLLVIIDKSAYINPYEGQLFRLTFLLFAVKILTTKYSRNEILFLGMVGMVAAVSYFVNTKDEAVRAVALVAACKEGSALRYNSRDGGFVCAVCHRNLWGSVRHRRLWKGFWTAGPLL